MLNKLLLWAAKRAWGGKLLGLLASLQSLLAGKRSELLLLAGVIIHALKLLGLLDPAAAEQAEAALLGALPLALMERVSKLRATIDSALPEKPK